MEKKKPAKSSILFKVSVNRVGVVKCQKSDKWGNDDVARFPLSVAFQEVIVSLLLELLAPLLL